MNDILVTVVTVCKNSEKSIEKTIQSVISQTYNIIEYIIIDGLSEDNTLRIVDKYKPRISCVISERDNGIYDAMNKGVDFAHGELIAFLNSDDWYDEDAITNAVKCYSDSQADVVYGNMALVRSDGKIDYIKYSQKSVNELKYKMSLPHPASFVRTSILKKYHFDCNYAIASDYDLFYKLYSNGYRFKHFDAMTTFSSATGKSFTDVIGSYSEAREIALKYDVSGENRDYINNMFYSFLFNEKYLDDFENAKLNHGVKCVIGDYSVIIYGAGIIGKRCMDLFKYSGIEVVGFFDNDKEKQGTVIDGVEVFKPFEHINDNPNCIFVIGTKKEEEKITDQLIMNGIDRNKVITYNDLIVRITQEAENEESE